MTPDVTITDYYWKFIEHNKSIIKEAKSKLKNINNNKEDLYKYITENKNEIKSIVGINVNTCDEYTTKTYCKPMKLRNYCLKFIRNNNDTAKKVLVINCLKYCSTLEAEYNNKAIVNKFEEYNKLTLRQYEALISNYYAKVHKCVLQGFAYKFTNKLGSYIINRWSTINSDKYNKYVDYNATAKKKKEIIAAGKKPYNKAEAKWYADHNLEYDGIPYVIYSQYDKWYEFRFIGTKQCSPKYMEYQRTEYVNSKYRGMSYKQIADTLCNTEDDIYELPLDIKYKLNILLYKFPMKYLNFVRTNKEYSIDTERCVRNKTS